MWRRAQWRLTDLDGQEDGSPRREHGSDPRGDVSMVSRPNVVNLTLMGHNTSPMFARTRLADPAIRANDLETTFRRGDDGFMRRGLSMSRGQARVNRAVSRSAMALAALLVLGGMPAVEAVPASAAGAASRSQNSAAPGLARAVADARTNGARVVAVDHILGALHIDVLDPATGAELVQGSARTLYDGYLYSNEVAELAAAFQANIRVSLAQVATELNNAGYAKLHQPMTAARIAAALLAVTRQDSSASVPDSIALLARLVWQLGLLHKGPQNLDKPIKPARILLDPLQEWLVVADFTFPFINANPALTGPASTLRATSHGVIKASRLSHEAFHPCDVPFKKIIRPILKKAGSFALAALGQAFPKFGKYVVPIIPDLIDVIHGSIIGIGVTVTGWANPAETHLGGPDMYFHVDVQMILKLPSWVVKCGWLVGLTFPGKSHIEGVAVIWQDVPGLTDPSILADWGTLSCPVATCNTTNHYGIATLTFHPYPEPLSGGIMKDTPGTIAFVPFPNLRLKNPLGFLGDITRKDAIAWRVSHRVPHGWPTRIDATATFNDPSDFSGDFRTVGPVTISDAVQQTKCAPQYQGCVFSTSKISGTVAGGGCGTVPVTGGNATLSIWNNGTTGDLSLHVDGGSATCLNSDAVSAPLNWQPGDIGGQEAITGANQRTIIGTLKLHYIY